MATRKKKADSSDQSPEVGRIVRGKRIQVSKRIRFEVFKRDKFTCQYCGRKAPDVVLHIEHVEAVSRGGTNDVINLVAACSECNAGKSNVPLSDDTAIAKQHAQLAELQARREQQQMMLDWRRGLQEIHEETAEQVHEQWRKLVPGYSLNETGEQTLKRILRKYSVPEVVEAMEIAADKHLEFSEGKVTHESVNRAFDSIEPIARFQRLAKEDPIAAKLRYIRGILRNRFQYCPDTQALELLEDAHAAGVSIEDLTRIAKRERNWSSWREELGRLVERAGAGAGEHEDHIGAAALKPHALSEPETEIGAVQEALFSELIRLDEAALWQLVGYAKGVALISDALMDARSQDEDTCGFRSIKINSLGEAQGLADALRLARSAVRAKRLFDMEELDTEQVLDIINNLHPDFPMAPLLKYDEADCLVSIEHPLPQLGGATQDRSNVRADDPSSGDDSEPRGDPGGASVH